MLNEGWRGSIALLCKQWSLISLFSKHCCEVLSARQTNAGGMSSKVQQRACSYAASHTDSFPSAYLPVCGRREDDESLLVAALQRKIQPRLSEGLETGRRRALLPWDADLWGCARTNHKEGAAAFNISTLLTGNSHLIFRLRALRTPTLAVACGSRCKPQLAQSVPG